MSNDVWLLVHAERAALIADLEGLTEHQWAQPSPCPGWTVHDVVAHLVDVAESTRLGFARDMVKAGFDFDRQNDRGIARAKAATPAQTLRRLTKAATRTSTPIAPIDTRIVEEVVHGEDIRRPLGLHRDYPPEAIERSLRQQIRTSTKFGGAKELVAGVRLVATDTDLTIGAGREVSGTAIELLLACSGRNNLLAG
ncbi:maleylpyruvate isomerase family mycothiol-dependent enzyme [Mycolicibacterium sp. P9-22]|uniref:maleylpyruvate isomerase family mycothiol-dependent enzyme n=1 Tax=Mycolicibacterium sp. P9-22 TaxID=2024613 RepID=UPI0011EC6D6B|nr:maleylpyruvate isomerase family mycothiol-dependent enzyme [Mycolicibacterium sp. P9-22]KAA0118466.1 maleylpyruvate isomerase family mycothiol-dependent enzyme [Mycolicibacterium sp. P9-22]